MPAILIQKGFKYACKDWNFLNGFFTQHDHFEGILKKQSLQAHLVPTIIDIAAIIGLPYDWMLNDSKTIYDLPKHLSIAIQKFNEQSTSR